MTRLTHDTSNTMFREPAGAVRAGSAVVLSVLAAAGSQEETDCVPYLKVRFDRDSSLYCAQMRRERADGSSGTVYSAEFTPENKGLYWYWFETGPDGLSTDTFQLTVYDPAYDDPDWIRGGVFYHIFVDRFAASCPGRETADFRRAYADGHGKILRSDWGGMPGYLPDPDGEILNNDFFGGDLDGICEKLPYLESLGVTCLYLSPVFEAYSSHKYDTSDYMRIDPMFGDEAGFSRLCEQAAGHGIRIICDGVFSHTGSDSRYFDIYDRYGNGAYHHGDSPYRDWYYFEPDGYQTWWGIKTLPRVNKESASYQDFITGPDGVVRRWLRAGASGWRLDVVDELPSSFLEKLTEGAKAEKRDALILGEVWEDASNKIAYDERKNYFEGDKLDSVMNYPLRTAIIAFVRGGDAGPLADTMQMIMNNYPARVVHSLMNILGTHDTERILTALGGEILAPDADRATKASVRMDQAQRALGLSRLKTAVVLQMTLPGVPCIYYGDEAGMEGYDDPFNRRCYPWGNEDQDLLSWYRRLTGLRRAHQVYRDGDYRLLAARDGLFAFARSLRSAGSDSSEHGECLITAACCGDSPQSLHLFGTWTDLLTGSTFEDDVTVMPGQAMILQAV